MKATNSKVLLLMFLILFYACKKEPLNKTDAEIRDRYYNLEHTGWKSKSHLQKIDDINFVATEIPLAYFILKEIGNDDLFAVDSIEKQNNKERILEFEFRQDEEKDLLKEEFTGLPYAQSVEYMAFKIQKDFYAVTSKNDTVKCSGVTFERNFKVAPYQKALLFFSGINPDEEIQLVYKDRLFGKGTIKFMFKEKITKLIL